MCGDFNGSAECGAVRYVEDGFVDETFVEDDEPVTSGRKELPLSQPLTDAMAVPSHRPPPPTMVVAELLSTMVEGDAYSANPQFSQAVLERLERIYAKLATEQDHEGNQVMSRRDVEAWLTQINGQVGRGSEFRQAARQMGCQDDDDQPQALPAEGVLTWDGFLAVYQAELQQGKFWGIAHDLSTLGEALPDEGTFAARYDRLYHSQALQATAVMDFVCTESCPNTKEASDHLPVAASFSLLQ